jgi:hypothetical protein
MGDSVGSSAEGERQHREGKSSDPPRPARRYVRLGSEEDLQRGAATVVPQFVEVVVSAATGVAVRAPIDEAVRRLKRPKDPGKVAVIVGARGETLAAVRVDLRECRDRRDSVRAARLACPSRQMDSLAFVSRRTLTRFPRCFGSSTTRTGA